MLLIFLCQTKILKKEVNSLQFSHSLLLSYGWLLAFQVVENEIVYWFNLSQNQQSSDSASEVSTDEDENLEYAFFNKPY